MKNNASKKILIVDDEPEMRIALETTLQRENYQLVCAEDGKQALELFENQVFDLVLTDVRMPKLNGLELLREVKERSPETPVVMMTAYGAIDNAVEAMKEGAFDYLIKGSGFSADVLVSTVKRAFLNPQDYIPPARPSGVIDKTDSPVTKRIVTQDEGMKKLLKFAENVAYSQPSSLWERLERARNCLRVIFTNAVLALVNLSWRSIAPLCPKGCWSPNCSAMRRDRSREP
jgi:DNA-binding NtrC family response regulator